MLFCNQIYAINHKALTNVCALSNSYVVAIIPIPTAAIKTEPSDKIEVMRFANRFSVYGRNSEEYAKKNNNYHKAFCELHWNNNLTKAL